MPVVDRVEVTTVSGASVTIVAVNFMPFRKSKTVFCSPSIVNFVPSGTFTCLFFPSGTRENHMRSVDLPHGSVGRPYGLHDSVCRSRNSGALQLHPGPQVLDTDLLAINVGSRSGGNRVGPDYARVHLDHDFVAVDREDLSPLDGIVVC